MDEEENPTTISGFTALRREFKNQLLNVQYEAGVVGPRGPKGDKGDSVTAGSEPPSEIIPGVSVFIDAVSGEVYRYEED